MARRFNSFAEFYPFYLAEHADRTNRRLHFVGTSLVAVIALVAITTTQWWLLPAVPVAGYGFAWAGHVLVEKNRPATFSHPFYSLLGDFAMWRDMVLGRIKW